jgi:zinc transport system substrate-binding protein
MNKKALFRLGLFLCAFILPVRAAPLSQMAPVVVTTTLIETAVRDLMGNDVFVVRLMPPGSCPGHFDLDPGQVKHLSSAALFIRHDFQASLDAGVMKSGLGANRIVAITSRPAFTIPEAYSTMCAELAARLSETWPDHAAGIQASLSEIQRRANAAKADTLTDRTQTLHGRRALCAEYQQDFCRWMGLDVIAVFHAGADESAWHLSRAVDMANTAQAEAVIGNQQWGTRHLKALAEAAGLPGIMLSNFPASGESGAYWDLFEANVEALRKGLP